MSTTATKKTARPANAKHAGKFRKGGPMKIEIDYKNVSLLRTFVTEGGKILSGNVTGTCAKHQRELCQAIKRARMLALLPFAAN